MAAPDSSPCPPNLKLSLTEHRALVFDVYGTLVDWESAIHDALAPIFPDLPREEILRSYSRVEGNLQTQFQCMPYTNILELAYRQLATPSGLADEESRGEQYRSTSLDSDDAQCFGRSIPNWQPFPDTIDALHRLKRHFALVVLSNVDEQSFAGTHAKLCTADYPGSAYHTLTPDSPFSLVLTAERVGAYKPNPLMLESALRQLSAQPEPSLPSNPVVCVDASQVLVVANSMRHDILPAAHLGLRSVWVSRHGVNVIGNEGGVMAVGYSSQEGATVDVVCPHAWRYETLSGMADAVEREVPQRVR